MPPTPAPPTTLHPSGPASNPKYLPTLHPSNPYNFSPAILHCTSRPPLITQTHIYFFTHEHPTSPPLASLSQWFPHPFTGPQNPYTTPPDTTSISFPTAEHFMMYHKALLMGDTEVAGKLLHAENAHPSRAKRLGREVRGFDGEVWGAQAERVVEEGNWRKFSADEGLRRTLVATGERVLVEASPEDRIWGIGFSADDAEGREAEWGENKLGKALMRVRDRLNRETEQEGSA